MDEAEILEAGLQMFRTILGDPWQVVEPNRPVPEGRRTPDPGPPGEKIVYVQPPQNSGGGMSQVFVAARTDLSPLRARSEFQAKVALMHSLIGSSAVLVVAPWLSPRTREALLELGYNYLDLTGNVSLRLSQSAVIVRLEGAKQNPDHSARRHVQQLRGAQAGLVRFLVDATPPYRATELAGASGVSLSYISRLLDALEEETLITRAGRMVVAVDWRQLIRARASQYELLKANPYVGTLAPSGPSRVLERLREKLPSLNHLGRLAVTGPFAVREVIPPATIGGQLMIYVPADPRQNGPLDQIAGALGLLRTETGADVLLLRPPNTVVFDRTRMVSRVPYVALSQLAIDCLSGTGRMPAEGDALLDYMDMYVSEWRARNLSELADRAV